MNHTVGTCSRCGGRVSVPRHWLGITPPVPTCQSCGARVKRPHGPVLEMEDPRVNDPRPITNGIDG